MGYLLLKSPTSIAHVPALEANKLRDFGGSGYLKDQMTLKRRGPAQLYYESL